MPIVPADILIKYSTAAGTVGHTVAGTGAGSLGKRISTTEAADTTLHALFDAVSGDENFTGDVEYRCLFVHNSHGSLTMQATVLWIDSQTAGGATVAVAVDPTAATLIGASTVQALTVATEQTAPTGLTFATPTTKGAALALGDIPAGYCRAFWVRRTATNSAAVDADGAVIAVECDTAA